MEFVRTPGPAWEKPVYGGQFWLSGSDYLPDLPAGSFAALGLGAQHTVIVPAHSLVIVRMGYCGPLSMLLPPQTYPDPNVGPGPSVGRMIAKILEAVST